MAHSRISVGLVITIFSFCPAVEWDSLVRLTSHPAVQVPGLSYQKSIAVDPQGNIFVFWLDSRAGFRQIWYRLYEAGSGIWLPESQLTRFDINLNLPTAGADPAGNIHLLWHLDAQNYPQLRGIWYKRFDAATSRWLAETLVAFAPLPYNLKYPAVAVQPVTGALHIVYYGNPDTGGVPQVFHKEYQPGTGWLPAEQITAYPADHRDASVAVDSGGNLCVVWLGRDLGSFSDQVLCRRRIGGVWQEIEQVSELAGGLAQYSPAVTAGGNNWWHIVWQGYDANSPYYQICYRCRRPPGWSEITAVSGYVQFNQESPSIAHLFNNRCAAVWCGKTAGSPDHKQLLFALQESAGVWTGPQQLTGLTTHEVKQPVLVTWDRTLHILFAADSAGNTDLFYLGGRLPATGVSQPERQQPVRIVNIGAYPALVGFTPAGTRVRINRTGVYLIPDHRFRFQKVVVISGSN
ncbi:MAG: hypothetical protein ABIK38_04750 [candidate division WOR-3 bacterium]